MSGAPPTADGAAIRLDKWLWHARFCKTRSLAAKLVSGGRIRIDGRLVEKSHAAVRPGQVLTFALHDHVRVVKVLAPGTRRGPAPEAQALYEDLAPPDPANRLPRAEGAGVRSPGSGRPTKKDRRAIDRILGDDTMTGES